jgi:hypothetical protein
MKQAAHTIAVAALGACLASCGGGTLGGSGGASGSPGAGAGGFSGRGGWELGMAGTVGGPCVALPPPPICGDLCGNGRIDQCTIPPELGCPVVTAREQCDGDDFGVDSCEHRGYGSGQLACDSNCTVGMEDSCSPCVPQPDLVGSCRPGPVAAPNFAVHVMAANDSEIGLAVVEYDDSSATERLFFERLSPDLGMLSVTTVEQFREQPRVSFNGLAAASLPSGGWIVAVCGSSDIYFHTLDAAGRPRRRVVVSPAVGGYGCQTGAPVLAARPDGGPLLLWQDEAGLSMSVIAADGLSASAARFLREGLREWADGPAAAWIGNEFVVALPVDVDPATNVRALRLMRIAPDGTAALVGDFLTGEFLGEPTMAGGADARDVRILYWGVPPGGDRNTDSRRLWWRYDPAGQVRPSVFDAGVDIFSAAPGVAFGDDTVVLLGVAPDIGYGVMRVASDGRVVSPYRGLFQSPPTYGGGAAIVRRGPELVVSFGSAIGIHLARLTP